MQLRNVRVASSWAKAMSTRHRSPALLRSTFSQAVFAAVRTLYPESLADHSFDNTGVLLEAPISSSSTGLRPAALITIDLTRAVAEEAIAKRVSCVVAYHPIIFRALKSITLENTQQISLLRLAQQGISVYCPHTAVDAARGGNADWLADIVTGISSKEAGPEAKTGLQNTRWPNKDQKYTFQRWPAQSVPSDDVRQGKTFQLAARKHTRRPVIPNSATDNVGESYSSLTSASADTPGMGRLIHLAAATPLRELLDNLMSALGEPAAVSLALPTLHDTKLSADDEDEVENVYVDRIAVCAGSGGSIFNAVPARETDAKCNTENDSVIDLFITGELSHHESLAFVEQGKAVVCLGHSNSERGYLTQVMKPRLLEALQVELKRRGHDNARGSEPIAIDVSEKDTDPFGSWLIR